MELLEHRQGSEAAGLSGCSQRMCLSAAHFPRARGPRGSQQQVPLTSRFTFESYLIFFFLIYFFKFYLKLEDNSGNEASTQGSGIACPVIRNHFRLS